jgi:phage tail protein X
MNNTVVIDKTSEYAYVITLSPTLTPECILVADNIVITDIVANGGNIAYTERHDNITTLNFVGVGPDEQCANSDISWTVNLGDFTVGDLIFYGTVIAIVGQTNNLVIQVLQYNIDGTLKASQVLPDEGTVLAYQFAVVGNDFLLYTIADNLIFGRELVEYNVIDNILIWTTPIPQDSTLLAGTIDRVATASTNMIKSFTKRWPGLIGVVSEVIAPNYAGPGCAPFWSPCVVEGVQICCPDNPPLPNTGQAPYVVRVDFGLTSALAPVIPGQEYFINNDGLVTVDDTPPNKYIGTALDSTRVLLKMTGNVLN